MDQWVRDNIQRQSGNKTVWYCMIEPLKQQTFMANEWNVFWMPGSGQKGPMK